MRGLFSNKYRYFNFYFKKMSLASDAREKQIADNINALRIPVLSAVRPVADVKYADVKIKYKGQKGQKETWLEVKMNHSDNLGNVRVSWNGERWVTSVKDGITPLKQFMIYLLNDGPGRQQADQFLADVARFVSPKGRLLNKSDIKIPTTKGGLGEQGAIQLDEMKRFLQSKGSQYFINIPNINLGELVTKHYNEGKAAPVSYLQAGDDFFLLGSVDQLGIKQINPGIPKVTGFGNFKMRVGVRTQYYELQPEIKISNMGRSDYSLFSTSKKNPFQGLK